MYLNKELDELFLPIVFLKDPEQRFNRSGDPKKEFPHAIVLDLFAAQKKELFKIENPSLRLSEQELEEKYQQWIGDKNADEEGTWVYYPWSNRLLHILEKSEFITLRTSRNHYKISPEEQRELFDKKIAIIGLSVGHAVAISIATERICGKLKLADFDIIELSNLNRLKTGIHNSGINKCVVTAREIAEIDPFLDIECFTEGINHDNLDAFLTQDGNVDILIDECDDIETKIACRQRAKSLGIPVIMETSDRGMLDVERFDLEIDRPILHGFLAGIPDEKLKNISPQDRVPLVMKIVDALKGSVRGRASLVEVGRTISTWPQLASAVTLGGGVVTDVTRRILLNQFTDSGRYYVDLEEIIANTKISKSAFGNDVLHFDLRDAARILNVPASVDTTHYPNQTQLHEIIEAGTQAPSSGNEQPWKWIYQHGKLLLFHDKTRTFSFSNTKNISTFIALGASYQNIVLKSYELGYGIENVLTPSTCQQAHIATLYFRAIDDPRADKVPFPGLTEFIPLRSTNRGPGISGDLAPLDRRMLQEIFARNSDAQLHFYTQKDKIQEIGKIVGACDLYTLLHDQGHHDFFERNIRWTPEAYHNTSDGIPYQPQVHIPTLPAALAVLRDRKVAQALRTVGGGSIISEASQIGISQSVAVGMISVTDLSPDTVFKAGSSLQALWLQATALGYSLQPLFSPISLFHREATDLSITEDDIEKLNGLKTRFRSITHLEENHLEVFLFKLTKSGPNPLKTKRLPVHEILFSENDIL